VDSFCADGFGLTTWARKYFQVGAGTGSNRTQAVRKSTRVTYIRPYGERRGGNGDNAFFWPDSECTLTTQSWDSDSGLAFAFWQQESWKSASQVTKDTSQISTNL